MLADPEMAICCMMWWKCARGRAGLLILAAREGDCGKRSGCLQNGFSVLLPHAAGGCEFQALWNEYYDAAETREARIANTDRPRDAGADESAQQRSEAKWKTTFPLETGD